MPRDLAHYKKLVREFRSLMPDLHPRIVTFPDAAAVHDFPTQAVKVLLMTSVTQLVWLDQGYWKSIIMIENSDGTSAIRRRHGPEAKVKPARWALSHAAAYFTAFVAADAITEAERAAGDIVSVDYLTATDMKARMEALGIVNA